MKRPGLGCPAQTICSLSRNSERTRSSSAAGRYSISLSDLVDGSPRLLRVRGDHLGCRRLGRGCNIGMHSSGTILLLTVPDFGKGVEGALECGADAAFFRCPRRDRTKRRTPLSFFARAATERKERKRRPRRTPKGGRAPNFGTVSSSCSMAKSSRCMYIRKSLRSVSWKSDFFGSSRILGEGRRPLPERQGVGKTEEEGIVVAWANRSVWHPRCGWSGPSRR